MNGTVWAPFYRSTLEVGVVHAIEKAAFNPVDLHTQGCVCSAERPLNLFIGGHIRAFDLEGQ